MEDSLDGASRRTVNPSVSVVVLNMNGGSLLSECLDSLAAQTFTDYEVILVDNASSDGSWNLPHMRRPRWTLVRLDLNHGFAEGNNIGFKHARGRYVALVNNDVVLDSNWLQICVSVLDVDRRAASVATRILQKANPALLDSAGFALVDCGTTYCWRDRPAEAFSSVAHEPFGAVAAAAVYRKSVLEKTGLFHPEYFAYYEDTDLAMRLVLAGYSCVYANDAVSWHVGSATGNAGSDFQRYHLRRNIEYLFWGDMPGFMVWTRLPSHFAYECACFCLMVLRNQTGVFLKAKRDAFRRIGWMRERRRDVRALCSRKSGNVSTTVRVLSQQIWSIWRLLFQRWVVAG